MADRLTYDFYFGNTTSPPLVLSNSLTPLFDPPGDLDEGTTYYWRVVVRDMWGIETAGPLWKFTTFLPTPFSLFIKDLIGLEDCLVIMTSDFEHFVQPNVYDSGSGVSYADTFKNSDGTCKWSGHPFEYYFKWWYEKFKSYKIPGFLTTFDIDFTRFINSYLVFQKDEVLYKYMVSPVKQRVFHPFHPFVLNGTVDNDYCPETNTLMVLEGDEIVEYKVAHHTFIIYDLAEREITRGEEICIDTSLFRSDQNVSGDGYVACVRIINDSPSKQALKQVVIEKDADDESPFKPFLKFGSTATTCTQDSISLPDMQFGEFRDFYIKQQIPADADGAFGVTLTVNYSLA